MTNQEHTPASRRAEQLELALRRAHELASEPRPSSLAWMQAAEHAADLSLLALATER
jgi:hypothetical protein